MSEVKASFDSEKAARRALENARARARYAANPEKHRAKTLKQYEKKKDDPVFRARQAEKTRAWFDSRTPEQLEAHRAKDKARREANREKLGIKAKERKAKLDPSELKEQRRQDKLKHRYGLTREMEEEMIRAQDCLCAICDQDPGPRGFCVDHDHDTDKVRQLLCTGCNNRVGALENVLAAKMFDYIQAHEGDETSPLYHGHSRTKAVKARFAVLKLEQKGLCYICDQIPGGKCHRLCIDHNLVTGRMRKLLCVTCNTRVGYLESKLVEKTKAYVRKHGGRLP